MISTSEALRRLRELHGRTELEVGQLRKDAEEFAGAGSQLPAAAEEVRLQLAAKYLPQLTPEALEAAARRTGFGGFRRMDPLKAMARERTQLEHEIARIRADERYLRREELVGPHGEITLKIAEVQPHFDRWDSECLKFESLPGFLELVEKKYDTPDFQLRWWDPAYWRMWAQGDAICEKLGLNDFGDDVLPAYERARAPRDRWKAELEQLKAQRDSVLALVQKHDQDLQRRDRLPEIYLQECRQALAQHLATADLPLLSEWAQGEPAIQADLRRLAGIAAKMLALRQVVNTLDQHRMSLDSRYSGYARKLAKLSRPKHYSSSWDSSIAPPKGFTALDKSQKVRAGLRKAVKKILDYDDYEHFALTNPTELWWYEFTGSRPPSGMAWRSWYDRNPNPQVVYSDLFPEDDVSPEVLQAAASRGYDPLVDCPRNNST